jgi:nicotinamidase-related amidase
MPLAAVVAIDLHRGHLDPSVATMPAAPEVAARLVAANLRFLDAARAAGIPVIHCVTRYRDAD